MSKLNRDLVGLNNQNYAMMMERSKVTEVLASPDCNLDKSPNSVIPNFTDKKSSPLRQRIETKTNEIQQQIDAFNPQLKTQTLYNAHKSTNKIE